MKPIVPLYERILRCIFTDHYKQKDFKAKQHRNFLEKFPCKDCRPDLNYTFYDGIECYCGTCGRTYHI